MKKYLLLVSILCFLSPLSSAETDSKKDTKSEQAPEFNISGSATVSMDFANPDLTYYDGKNQPSQIKTDQKSTKEKRKDTTLARCVANGELVFSAKGKLNNGWIYGANLSLDAVKNDTGISNMYVLFERDNFGTIHAGNVTGPDGRLLCGGQELIGGQGGVDGVLPDDIDYATGVVSPVHVIGYANKATKVAYYTPKIYGFQVGLGITPDTKQVGHKAKSCYSEDSSIGNDAGLFKEGDHMNDLAPRHRVKPAGRNNIALGLTHGHDFQNGWGTQIAAIYVMENTQSLDADQSYVGDVVDESGPKPEGTWVNPDPKYIPASKGVRVKKIKLRNARAWHATAMVSYKDFSVGVGYLNNGRSRLPAASAYINDENKMVLPGGFLSSKEGTAGQAWNVGMKYNYKEWTFSGVYHNTSRRIDVGQKAKGNMFTLATDYLVCPGLKLFVELDYVITRAADYSCATYNLVRTGKNAVKKQKTGLFVIGAKVCF
ncbi:MAG: porin [Holosporales bacterium]|jgi:predicted porin|nr:porin [Holosporales bacterium]